MTKQSFPCDHEDCLQSFFSDFINLTYFVSGVYLNPWSLPSPDVCDSGCILSDNSCLLYHHLSCLEKVNTNIRKYLQFPPNTWDPDHWPSEWAKFWISFYALIILKVCQVIQRQSQLSFQTTHTCVGVRTVSLISKSHIEFKSSLYSDSLMFQTSQQVPRLGSPLLLRVPGRSWSTLWWSLPCWSPGTPGSPGSQHLQETQQLLSSHSLQQEPGAVQCLEVFVTSNICSSFVQLFYKIQM